MSRIQELLNRLITISNNQNIGVVLKSTSQLAYLAGLVVGRGRLFDSGRVVIEFSHTNKSVSGIAHCPKCNSVATQKNKIYSCKSPQCSHTGFEPVQNTYDQVTETKESINKTIIPFLKEGLDFEVSVMANLSITLLILDFNTSAKSWIELTDLLGTQFHFHFGHIPKKVLSYEKKLQIEFVNGLLDTSGFCNSGGWLPRKGLNSEIRQRVYFQVVRNWSLTVEIDNFLRSQFEIPIQTIDWGHPNIRDANLVDVQSGKTSAFAREHQLKVYPEYLKQFKFRISSKQKMFQELLEHNVYGGFAGKEDWFPPKKIKAFKPYHPDEQNARMALSVRKHFDAFWQINLALGCKYLSELAQSALNPEVFALTGELDNPNSVSMVEQAIENIRPVIVIEPEALFPSLKKPTLKSKNSSARTKEDLEIATYPILKNYFDSKYFPDKEMGEFHITNFSTLSSFMKNQPEDFIELFEECEEYKIRPDLVGFDKNEKKLIFVESKVDPLDMRMVGQLLSYCLVARPKEAYLLSTQLLSPRLLIALSSKPEVLNYGDSQRIQIGQIRGNVVDIHAI
jgi:hypothetical protein